MAVCPNCGEDNPERARLCMMCGASLRTGSAPPQEARKTVTVLFCDLVGSTALGERLDSESLREVMDRYFAEMKRIVERHGGIVEKYIGDAVMAVFGLPRAHDDDALRAVRAASEIGQTLNTLNTELDRNWGVTLANRTGVNTGEVVVGDPSSGQRLATGDTVNVAARLEQAAPPASVLMGEPTYRLVRDAVEVGAVEPLALKGKSEHLPAYQVLAVRPLAEGVARRLDAPLVGREGEVTSLIEAFQQAVRENSCRLVAVLGEAGVGKSRLVAEVTQRLARDATVLRGRCLSYGEGITFWPVAEMVREAAAISERDSITQARTKVAALADQDKEIAERVQALVGLSNDSFAIQELFWALRRLLEGLAQHRPLLVVIEDLHWAEPTLLDLLRHVVELARTASILLICTARKEGFERGSDWLNGLPDVPRLVLKPLTTDDSQTLIHNLLGSQGLDADTLQRITQAAQGNPLFVEQILAMWLDEGTLTQLDGRWSLSGSMVDAAIPPTLSALLAARLDALEQVERTVIAGASVVGQVFYQGAVQELCPSDLAPEVPTKIETLTTKEFIRPDVTTFANEKAFAFRHVLVRNAAYEAMLKRTRVSLHERFADWLEGVTGERISEYEEIVGYHLEQAYKYRSTLGVVDAEARTLGDRAAHALASAGTRAMARSDVASAVNLLERAVDLSQEVDESRFEVMLNLGTSLTRIGNTKRAEQVLTAVAEGSGDASMRLHANIERAFVALAQALPQSHARSQHLAEKSIRVFEQLGDRVGTAKAWRLMATVSWNKAQFDTGIEALRRALHFAQGHDKFLEMQITSELIMAMAFGPTPVQEVIRQGEEMLEHVEDRVVIATLLSTLRLMYAWLGEFDHARELGDRAEALCRDLGQHVLLAWWCEEAALVELAAGDLTSAEEALRRGCDALARMGENASLSTRAAELADILCSQRRYGEAEEYAALSERTADPDDIASQARMRAVRARIMASRGGTVEAIALAQEAASLADTSDDLDLRGYIWHSRADALRRIERIGEAVHSAKTAVALYEQKGNIVSAAKARKLLEELIGGASAGPIKL